MFSLKKCAAFFVTVGIVCVLFSCPALAENATGYIPEPFDTMHLYNDPPRFPAKHTNNDRVGTTDDSLPVSYDLRDYGRVPAVRNQNPYGTCWAHATLGAMESNYLTQKLNGTINDIDSVDLSELHMSWYVYKDPGEGKAFPIGTANFGTGVLGQGGNAAMSTAYLTRLAGPVYESVMPYSAAGTDKSKADTTMTTLVGSKKATHPSYAPIALRLLERYNMGLISTDNRDLVKQMIMEHGAMQVSYYAGAGATSPSGGTTAYFDNSEGTYTNHAVLIVGWDDNFASKDFNADASKCPKNNGAWLVRNSWGADWPSGKTDADGYFWMSYEQFISYGYIFIAGNYEYGLKHYGYDDLGVTHASGASKNACGANVFRADGNEIIESAAFYTWDNNTSCDVYVYDLGTEKPSSPVSGTASTYSSGHYYPIAGYHTVKFDSPVSISAGHYFSVVVKFEYNGTAYVPLSNSGKIVSGVSYMSGSLISGWSVRTTDNACIKAFTTPDDSDASGIAITPENFPDEYFCSYLMSMFGKYLSAGEIAAAASLAPNYLEISDLTGIGFFTNLEELDLSGNSLKTADFTNNTALRLANVSCDYGVNFLSGDKSSKLMFVGNSLVLRGQLGLDFYVQISDDVDSSDVYIDFTVNGKTGSKIPFSDGVKQTDGTYMFTCCINSVQMADEITAVIHYATNSTTVKYTVSKYLDQLIAFIDSNYATASEDLKALANAIKDYGHYVQPILAETNGWTLGTDHKIMACNDTEISSDITAVKAYLDDNYKIDKSGDGMSDFSGLSIDLELDTDTAVNLYFRKADGVDGDVSATLNGSAASVSKQSDGSYLVSITGIPAHELGADKIVCVKVGSGAEYQVKLQALTYAQLVLNYDSAETSLKEAVIALYKYFKATEAYRSNAGL